MKDPAPDLVDVVLHIGADKTGTTSLQQLLRRNRTTLATYGVLYPRSPGRVRHVEIGLYARSDENLLQHRDWLRGDYPAPDVFRRRLRRRLVREVVSSGASTALLSDEALFRMKSEAITRLRTLLDEVARSVRVVVYLRRQDDHLASSYQQAVKVGETRTMRQWVTEHGFRNMYDYRLRLETWRDALQPDELVVRPFERSRFVGGSLVEDYLIAAGLPVPRDAFTPMDSRNERLDAEAVEVLRILNFHRTTQGAAPWQISNRDHVRRLRSQSTGPQLALPAADLDRFMEQWREPNTWVAREHLAEDQLFREPRRTTGTTSDQGLDPSRLEHYLDLLEILEQDHHAIRAIAEDES